MRKYVCSLIPAALIVAFLFFVPDARADHLDGHTLDTRTTAVEAEVMTPGQGLPQQIADLEAQVAALETDNTALQPLIDLVNNCTVTVVTGSLENLSGPHFIISGCNVHVRNGSGSTGGAENGTGNLIIGYNEEPTSPPADYRDGSHNLVIGQKHTYKKYGGLVAGNENTVSGASATVSGGRLNIASGDFSNVSGGESNSASGYEASVSGGGANTASGDQSSVTGGSSNEASATVATVSGGKSNLASYQESTVSGGTENTASAQYSTVGGGRKNTASGYASTVSGGNTRSVSGIDDWRGGGLFQEN